MTRTSMPQLVASARAVRDRGGGERIGLDQNLVLGLSDPVHDHPGAVGAGREARIEPAADDRNGVPVAALGDGLAQLLCDAVALSGVRVLIATRPRPRRRPRASTRSWRRLGFGRRRRPARQVGCPMGAAEAMRALQIEGRVPTDGAARRGQCHRFERHRARLGHVTAASGRDNVRRPRSNHLISSRGLGEGTGRDGCWCTRPAAYCVGFLVVWSSSSIVVKIEHPWIRELCRMRLT